jgi:hypothetical protein
VISSITSSSGTPHGIFPILWGRSKEKGRLKELIEDLGRTRRIEGKEKMTMDFTQILLVICYYFIE